MKAEVVPVGPYAANCIVASAGGEALVVDPGADPDRIVEALGRGSLRPVAILLTHAHFDHVGAVPALLGRFPGLPVLVGAADVPFVGHPLNQCPPAYPAIARPKELAVLGERLALPSFASGGAFASMQVMETPGHTPGGVCYFFPEEKLMFSGDTLFAGSAGRTDLPGGDMAKLRESLAKLAELPDDIRVIPGHGPATTIGRERLDNPFFAV